MLHFVIKRDVLTFKIVQKTGDQKAAAHDQEGCGAFLVLSVATFRSPAFFDKYRYRGDITDSVPFVG